MDSLRKALRRLLPKPAICHCVTQWAGLNAVSGVRLHDAVYDEIKPILTSDPRGSKTFNYFEEEFRKEQYLFKLTGTRIRGASGLLILRDGSFALQGQWFSDLLTKSPDFNRIPAGRKQRIAGNCYSLLSHWCDEYYHWFHDVLPRLYTALPHLPADTRFLINPDPREYQLISLAAMGIPSSSLLEREVEADALPELLWFATPLGHTNGTSGAVLQKVGATVRQHVMGTDSKSDNKLWISRRNARRRRISNEVDLIPLLTDHGFEIVEMEALSWNDQVRMASSATHLFGLHGAGLVSSIFSDRLSNLGEIAFEGMFPHYRTIAMQLGATYSRLVQRSDTHSSDRKITVDLHEFESCLNSFAPSITSCTNCPPLVDKNP